MRSFVLILIFITGCASFGPERNPAQTQSGWPDYIRQTFIRTGKLAELLPDVGHFLGWQPSRDVAMEGSPPSPTQLGQVALNCHSSKLYPTHPQEITKEYFFAYTASYDIPKLPPTSPACLVKSPAKTYCQNATWANLMVISDTYTDACGNLYRAHWFVAFLKTDENMGTLLSKGRTVYHNPHSEFEGDFVIGNTYEVDVSDFLFLSHLLPGDEHKIRAAQVEALRLGYSVKKHLYIPRP